MKGWTTSHIEELAKQGKIRGFTPLGKQQKSSRAKYGNSKVEWEGQVFDSKREYRYYRKLLLRLKTGEIGQLERQVKYVLIEAQEGQRKCEYWADFRWIETATGETVVCDAKGMKTEVYKIKKKLMKERYGITILEV